MDRPPARHGPDRVGHEARAGADIVQEGQGRSPILRQGRQLPEPVRHYPLAAHEAPAEGGHHARDDRAADMQDDGAFAKEPAAVLEAEAGMVRLVHQCAGDVDTVDAQAGCLQRVVRFARGITQTGCLPQHADDDDWLACFSAKGNGWSAPLRDPRKNGTPHANRQTAPDTLVEETNQRVGHELKSLLFFLSKHLSERGAV